MAEIVSAVVGFLTCLCTPNCINTPIVQRCKYVMNPKKYIKKLGKLKADIIARQKDVTRRLEEVEVVSEVRRSEVVVNWLKDVDLFLEATNGIEEGAKKTRPNVRMGSSIARLLGDATELLEKIGGLSEGDLTIMTKRGGEEIPVGRIIGETTTMERVWDCLMNDKISTVGVYGMGGVGKTTIVKKINNRLLEEKHLFDLVIWVTVSQSTNIRQIQDKIAIALNHSLPQTEDEVQVSASLLGALKQRKKVVLILDDMWEEVSLQKIGIPEPTEENGCKILLTTRKLEVCRKMGCRENSTIRVNLLSENEAWELFMDKVGVELSEEVRNIAESVVKECACLPLALVTVGGAMSGTEDIHEWRVALNDLTYFRSQQIVGMETDVFSCLKFSYDRLPDENVKKCFLYCALFPEDWSIEAEKLIDYWIMGGLIEGKDSQDEIDQGQFILNKLRNYCLLEIGDNNGVKMHDLIRDMALKYTSLLPSIVIAGVSLEKLPSDLEQREDLLCASFMNNKIEEISISPRCPKLSILLLNNNILHSIQEHFFVQMQGLRVLDLSRNWSIEFLPDSISELVNLHGLLLEGCNELTRLPSLSKLQLLRTLDLRYNSRLQSLPDSLSELKNLLVLRLSECFKLMSVPSVAKLRSLRKLELNGSGIMELPQGMEMLVNLTFLNLDETKFKFRETTPSGLLSALSSLNICDELEYIIKHEEEEDECTLLQGLEVLRIRYCPKLHSVYKGNLSSVYCLTKFKIIGCDNLNNVFSSPRLLQSLEIIEISFCDQLEEIIKAETAEEKGEATNTITLPKLKQLNLWFLPKLKNIWNGEMVCDSLKNLEVTACPEMKRIPTLRGEKQLPPPLLSTIEGSSKWWDSLEWDHPSTKTLYQPYFRPRTL